MSGQFAFVGHSTLKIRNNCQRTQPRIIVSTAMQSSFGGHRPIYTLMGDRYTYM